MVTLEREEAKVEEFPPLSVRVIDGQCYVKACTEAKGWYAVDPDAGICECPHFQIRLRELPPDDPDRVCKHLAAAEGYREEQARCPCCLGAGFWYPNPAIRLYNMEPIPLTCCLGAGTRSAWEELGSYPTEVWPWIVREEPKR